MLIRERHQIAILIVAGAMLSGFVLFWYLPLQKKRNAIGQIRTAQKFAIAKASVESGQMAIFKTRLEKLQDEVGDYGAKIPRQGDLGLFLQQMANLMNELNLKEQVITPDKEIQADELNCIAVDIQCKGRLAQIFEFYKRMQTLDRLVRIEQVKLVNDSSFSGEVSVQTKAVIYYKAQAGQA